MSTTTASEVRGPTGNNALSAESISKIHKDLDMVRNNMTVFSEMLTELNSGGQGNPADLELLQELYKTCKEMQSRVGQLLCTPTTDELTIDMLQINDDLNDLFDRYTRKTGGRNKGIGGTATTGSELPLIDLGDEGSTPSLISDLQAIKLSRPTTGARPPADDADFDQFVQSRKNSVPISTNTTTTATAKPTDGAAMEEIMSGHRETDFEEMEAWLKANPGAAGDASLSSIPNNPQFDNYLAGRAASATQKDKPS